MKKSHTILQFEQLNENILLDEKVVFTLSKLMDYVQHEYSESLYDMVFVNNSSHNGDPSFDVFEEQKTKSIEQLLDNEEFFQKVCNEYYASLPSSFQSANTEQETNRDLK